MKTTLFVVAISMVLVACAEPTPSQDASSELFIECERTAGDPFQSVIYKIEPEQERWSWWNADGDELNPGPRWEVFDCGPEDECHFDDVTLEFGWVAGDLAQTVSISRISGQGKRTFFDADDFERWRETSILCQPTDNPAERIDRRL